MKKNICMVAYTNYLSDARVRRAAETLAALPNYRVTVLVLRQSDTARTYELSDVTIQELNLSKYRGKSSAKYMLEYMKFLFLALWACTNRFLKGSLDAVHVHNMPNFLVFSAIIPRTFGKRVVLDVHDTLIETYASKFLESGTKTTHAILMRLLMFEESLSCRFASSIICVNHIQKKALTDRGIPNEKITVVLNAPDPRWFDSSKSLLDNDTVNSPFRLVYFGTLTKRLGVDLAIRAVSALSGSIPDLEFHVIGDGEQRAEFLRLSESLGVEKNVCFYEKIYPVDELSQILQGMHLVIVPNRRNVATELMLPVKMLEGVALGIPIVAPRLKAIQYYFPDETVFYYEPGSVESLGHVIRQAYESKELRIAKAAKAREFLVEYGWERHRFELINLYNRLCH